MKIPGKPLRIAVFSLAIALAVGLVAAGAAVRWALAPARPDAPEVLFTIEKGQPLGVIARRLEAGGIVRSALAMKWIARSGGIAQSLHAGEYWVSASLPPAAILEKFAKGLVATWEVVIPEGLTAVEIAQRLAALRLVDPEAFLAVVRDPQAPARFGVEGDSLEGYLFPETYRIARGLPTERVVRILVGQFLVVWAKIAPLAEERGMSMAEVVTLASMIEKETGAAEERPLIASVFLNRLRRGMRLESDPTTIYGIPDFNGNLRRIDLENADNPYNTYKIPGLPPGPIASPGRDSLRAVVEPADSHFLYFVARGDGTHVFSNTFLEHQVAVDRYQIRRRRKR